MSNQLSEDQLTAIAQNAVLQFKQSKSGPLVAHPIEYTDSEGNRLDVSRYTYQPFPKMMYGPKGQTRIVNDQKELSKLGKDWSATPKLRPAWDVRKQDSGYTLSEHHLEFFNSLDFGFKSIKEATAYFNDLAEEAQIEFLQDAEAWEAPAATGKKAG